MDCKDSREGAQGTNSVRRRRLCAGCGFKFTTHETIDAEIGDLKYAALCRLVLARLRQALNELGEELNDGFASIDVEPPGYRAIDRPGAEQIDGQGNLRGASS